MATLTIEMACGCFNRSDYEKEQSFETAEAAQEKAQEMIDDMNNNFCGRHTFGLDSSNPEQLVITVKNTFEDQ